MVVRSKGTTTQEQNVKSVCTLTWRPAETTFLSRASTCWSMPTSTSMACSSVHQHSIVSMLTSCSWTFSCPRTEKKWKETMFYWEKNTTQTLEKLKKVLKNELTIHAVLRDFVYVLQMLLNLLLQDPLSDTPAVKRLDQTLHFLQFGHLPPAAKHLCQQESSAKFKLQSLRCSNASWRMLQQISFVSWQWSRSHPEGSAEDWRSPGPGPPRRPAPTRRRASRWVALGFHFCLARLLAKGPCQCHPPPAGRRHPARGSETHWRRAGQDWWQRRACRTVQVHFDLSRAWLAERKHFIYYTINCNRQTIKHSVLFLCRFINNL